MRWGPLDDGHIRCHCGRAELGSGSLNGCFTIVHLLYLPVANLTTRNVLLQVGTRLLQVLERGELAGQQIALFAANGGKLGRPGLRARFRACVATGTCRQTRRAQRNDNWSYKAGVSHCCLDG